MILVILAEIIGFSPGDMFGGSFEECGEVDSEVLCGQGY